MNAEDYARKMGSGNAAEELQKKLGEQE